VAAIGFRQLGKKKVHRRIVELRRQFVGIRERRGPTASAPIWCEIRLVLTATAISR
jgi:hypothetical protein